MTWTLLYWLISNIDKRKQHFTGLHARTSEAIGFGQFVRGAVNLYYWVANIIYKFRGKQWPVDDISCIDFHIRRLKCVIYAIFCKYMNIKIWKKAKINNVENKTWVLLYHISHHVYFQGVWILIQQLGFRLKYRSRIHIHAHWNEIKKIKL